MSITIPKHIQRRAKSHIHYPKFLICIVYFVKWFLKGLFVVYKKGHIIPLLLCSLCPLVFLAFPFAPFPISEDNNFHCQHLDCMFLRERPCLSPFLPSCLSYSVNHHGNEWSYRHPVIHIHKPLFNNNKSLQSSLLLIIVQKEWKEGSLSQSDSGCNWRSLLCQSTWPASVQCCCGSAVRNFPASAGPTVLTQAAATTRLWQSEPSVSRPSAGRVWPAFLGGGKVGWGWNETEWGGGGVWIQPILSVEHIWSPAVRKKKYKVSVLQSGRTCFGVFRHETELKITWHSTFTTSSFTVFPSGNEPEIYNVVQEEHD